MLNYRVRLPNEGCREEVIGLIDSLGGAVNKSKCGDPVLRFQVPGDREANEVRALVGKENVWGEGPGLAAILD